MTLQKLLEEGAAQLRTAQIAEAELDARELLLEAFHLDMTHFLLDKYREMKDDAETGKAAEIFRETIGRRAKRIPLSQITGSREFMGLNFLINEHVLIPRQDTETLVEAVLNDYKGQNPKILDLCTGSGCIAVSLSVLGGFTRTEAGDISTEALKVAAENAVRLLGNGRAVLEVLSEKPWKVKITVREDAGQVMIFKESDLFGEFDPEKDGLYDVIVSNPPYIPSSVIGELEPEVRDYEPRLALDGLEDGLFYYRRLAADAGRYLNAGGAVYFEIGYDQAEAVCALLEAASFEHVRVLKDAPGLDRVVTGVRKSREVTDV